MELQAEDTTQSTGFRFVHQPQDDRQGWLWTCSVTILPTRSYLASFTLTYGTAIDVGMKANPAGCRVSEEMTHCVDPVSVELLPLLFGVLHHKSTPWDVRPETCSCGFSVLRHFDCRQDTHPMPPYRLRFRMNGFPQTSPEYSELSLHYALEVKSSKRMLLRRRSTPSARRAQGSAFQCIL